MIGLRRQFLCCAVMVAGSAFAAEQSQNDNMYGAGLWTAERERMHKIGVDWLDNEGKDWLDGKTDDIPPLPGESLKVAFSSEAFEEAIWKEKLKDVRDTLGKDAAKNLKKELERLGKINRSESKECISKKN